MNHTIEVIERCKDISIYRHIWKIRLDGLEMTVEYGTTSRWNTNPNMGVVPKFKFSNSLVTKHKDYKNIRTQLLHILKAQYKAGLLFGMRDSYYAS